MIQIYTGDGKGKTTAALGLALRSAGHGFKVRIIQFMKGSTYSGELLSLSKLGVEVYQFGRTCPHAAVIKNGFMQCQKCNECWIGKKEINDLDRHKINLAWQLAKETLNKDYQLLILDEIMNAIKYNLVSLQDVLAFTRGLPEGMELVLTGRDAPRELIERAHLVSEMKKIKHPYDFGLDSRRGIEY
ncbi:MAG: cob(I)yrinic acid a,c-diamide adenosyltransferase [Syntrophomonas sp.]